MVEQITKIGEKVTAFLSALGEITLYYGASLAAIFRGKLDWAQTLLAMERLGVNSLPIVIIINAFAGMVISLHLSSSFVDFGLVGQMGHLLTIAFSRELAPVLTGIIVAGRASSAIAAEIGAMAVSEQIDALKSLDIDPQAYLIAPKILGVSLMLPFLIIIANLTGLLGGMGLAVYFKHVTVQTFVDSILTHIQPWDFLGGLAKGLFFGLLVAGIGVYYGLQTKDGATGVGTAATQAVVSAIIALFIFNLLLTVLFY
ncbi:MAG TPA: ABC transporter permease [Firmicutes bacterium]|nr:ABC transporter permease [Bacillota bacterium]